MPFNYFDIEDSVSTRLAIAFNTDAIVTVMYDNEKEAQDAIDHSEQSDRPLVTVIYNGSAFDPSAVTNYIQQDDTISIVCCISFNKMRGDYGIHNTIRRIKNSLLGYRPPNASRLQLKSIEFIERDTETGNFNYNITFTCIKKQVQTSLDNDDDTSAAANLTQVSWDDKSIT